MTHVWKIVRKDAQRIRVPLAIFGALFAALIAYGAYIGGVFGQARAPRIGSDLFASGPDGVVVRVVIDVLLVYFLVGWMAHQDPVAGRDPFWITRPISGGELLAAKLCGAGIFFVVLPLVLHLPWWLMSGFGPTETAAASGQVVLEFGTITLLALAVAAVTDGFPRFLLWSLVSAGVVTAIVGLIRYTNASSEAVLQSVASSKFPILAVILDFGAVIVLLHQYLTLRLVRSIAIGGIAMVAACIIAATSTVDLLLASIPEVPATEAGRISVSGEPWYNPGGGPRRLDQIMVPLTVTGPPVRAWVSFDWTAEWKAGGETLRKTNHTRDWFRTTGVADTAQMRRVVGLGVGNEPTDDLEGSLSESMSIGAMQRLLSGPSSLHAEVTLRLLEREVIAEFPLRESTVRENGRLYSMTAPVLSPMTERILRRIPAQLQQSLGGNRRVLEFDLTIRSQARLIANYDFSRGGLDAFYVVVNRKTGDFLMPYQFFGSNYGEGIIRGVYVGFGRFAFSAPPEPGWIDDASLIVIRMNPLRAAPQVIDVDPLVLRRRD